MKKSIVFPLLLFLMIAFICSAQKNQVTIIDDYSSNFAVTMSGVTKTTFTSNAPNEATISLQKEAGDTQDPYLTISYNINKDKSYTGLAYRFAKPFDLSKFGYISFRIKKQYKQQLIRLQFKTVTDTVFLAVDDFIDKTISPDVWLRVCIPVQNICIRKELTELVYVIDNTIFKLNQAPLAGEISINDLLLGSGDQNFFVIDRFSDRLSENACGGGISGAFSSDSSYPEAYTFFPGDSAAYAKLNFDSRSASFGGAYFIFKKKVLNDFTALKLDLWSPSANMNPGTIKLELKKNNINNGAIYKNGISLVRQTFDIPFNAFSPVPDSISEFTIVFEKNVQDRNSGTLYIDNILLTKPNYNSTVSFNPSFTTSQDGLIKTGNEFIRADADIKVRPDISTQVLLESITLLKQSDDNEVILSKTYASGAGEYNLSIPQQVESGNILKIKMDLLNGNSRTVSYKLCPFGLQRVLKDGIAFIESARSDKGIYRDALLITGNPFHPASTASNGFGILNLVLSSAHGSPREEALKKVVATLKTLLGYNFPIPFRSPGTGYFYHWYSMNTFEREWNSEISSIDQTILLCCSLIAADYFDSEELNRLVFELFRSTDFSAAIEPIQKKVYREFNITDGKPKANILSDLFNEYILTLEMAAMQEKLAEKGGSGPSNKDVLNMWEYFRDIKNFPKITYSNLQLLTDQPSSYISHFIIQYVYYLSSYFSRSDSYRQFFLNTYLADSTCFGKIGSGYFGLGAGVMPDNSYLANNLTNNQMVYTPAILAGYLPNVSEGHKNNITNTLMNFIWEGKYVKTPDNLVILPRRSANPVQNSWFSNEIAIVDYFPLVAGLTTLYLPTFFESYKNFEYQIAGIRKIDRTIDDFIVFPNPSVRGSFTVRIQNPAIKKIRLISSKGSEVTSIAVNSDSLSLSVKDAGIYILQSLTYEGEVRSVRKIIVSQQP